MKFKLMAVTFLSLVSFQAFGDGLDDGFSPQSYGGHGGTVSSEFLVGSILDNQKSIAAVDHKVDKLEAKVDQGFKDIRSQMKAGFERIDGTLAVILDFMNRSQAHQERAEAFMADSTYRFHRLESHKSKEF